MLRGSEILEWIIENSRSRILTIFIRSEIGREGFTWLLIEA